MKTYQFVTFAVLLAAAVAIIALNSKPRKKCNCQQHADTETDLGVVEDAG